MFNDSLNFIRGIGSAFNLAPSDSRSHAGRGINLSRSDSKTLGQDWCKVSKDFRTAFDKTTKKVHAHDRTGK